MTGGRGRAARGALGLGVLLAACGSRRPPPGPGHRDAGDAGIATDAAPIAARRAGTEPGYRVMAIDDVTGGRLAARVEWPTAPAELRRSPGRTACGTPRAPRVRVGTLHGVADVVVVVDVTAGKAPPVAAAVRLAIRTCAIAPTVAVAPGLDGTVELQSQDEQPHHLTALGLGPVWRGPATREPIAAAALPAMGHVVSVRLTTPGVVQLVADGADGDAAYLVAPPHPYLAITDAVGAVTFDQLPPGTYPVHAWLPPAAGQAAVAAVGSAVITAGATTDLTLTLAAP